MFHCFFFKFQNRSTQVFENKMQRRSIQSGSLQLTVSPWFVIQTSFLTGIVLLTQAVPRISFFFHDLIYNCRVCNLKKIPESGCISTSHRYFFGWKKVKHVLSWPTNKMQLINNQRILSSFHNKRLCMLVH